jgi:hypothetical protein
VSEENLRSVNSPSVTGRSRSVGRSLRSVSCNSKEPRLSHRTGGERVLVVYRGGEHGGG